jgi:predicted nucleic acid-binding protein
MTVFIDTSAFYALLDADDGQHQPARQAWATLVSEAADLVCSNYVVVETTALVQNRLGVEAVRVFQEDVLPVVRIEWVDEPIHQAGVTALLTAGRRHLSLVDCVSFDLMRRFGMRRVFAFDEHFAGQGFEIIPTTTQAR